MSKIILPKDINLSEDFKLQFNVKHDYLPGTFEQKYIDHYCNGSRLSNMEEFITSQLHFKEFGIYTNATPNSHPNSQWMKFWREERRRCIEGYNIGRDWIPGYLYFYWNYTPIHRVKVISQEEGVQRIRGERVFDFPDIYDIDYYWFHYLEEAEKRGQHGSNLKKRGIGASFKGGSMLCRNYFLIPGSKSYAFADQKEYLIKDGVLTKAWELMNWIDDNTAWTKRRLKNTEMHKKAGYQKILKSGAKIEAGYGSEILGVTLEGNTDKARGKRGKLILWEESGNNNVLRSAWVVALSSMQEDDITYGLMVGFGTGGTEGANFQGLEELMRKPVGYNIYDIPNIFDGRIHEKVGFFIPTYINRRGCTDKNGNSDIIKAVQEVDAERKKTKANMSNNIYLRTLAEHPYTIDEAVLRMEGSPFDVATIKEVLSELKTETKSSVEWGEFNIDSSGQVQWKNDMSKQPILEYPLSSKDMNTEGCWVIYERPKKDENGNIPNWRNIAALDPIDFGSEETGNDNSHSLASCFIMDSITRTIIAEYTGRPTVAEKYYEQLWRGIQYYNAELLYENNLKGVFSYFRNKNKLHLLANEPECLKDRFGYKANNRIKGFHATKPINNWGRELLNEWSLEDHVIGQNPETGELQTVPKMYTIKSIPLLQEMEKWNSKGNFDRISSMGALLILLNDRQIHLDNINKSTADRFSKDKLFTAMKNFGKSNKMKYREQLFLNNIEK